MKHKKLALVSLFLAAFCGESASASIFSKSARILPNRCRFTNDSKASVWVSQTINGKINNLGEVKPGAMLGITGSFTVETHNPTMFYTTVMGEPHTFFVPEIVGCPGNKLNFTTVKNKFAQTIPQGPTPGFRESTPAPQTRLGGRVTVGVPPF